MSSFPLFRVPHVVFSQIVNSFDLSVIVISSFCSARMGRLIKVYRRKIGKLRIELSYHHRVYLNIKRNRQEEFNMVILPLLEPQETYRVAIGDYADVPVTLSTSKLTGLNIHFEDDFEGIKAVAVYITDLFSAPVKKIIPDAAVYPDGTRRIINWILERQGKIERCFIECKKMTDVENAFALSHCKFMKSSFFMRANYSPQFRHEFEYDGEYIELKNCVWFTLNNLLTINPRYYFIEGTRLTSSDINKLLKQWIAGGSFRIENVHITTKRIDRTELFEGIPFVERDASVQRIYKRSDGRETTVNGGLDITNGKATATVLHNFTDFWMVVWKDG